MPRYDTEDIDKTSQDLQLEFLDESTYLADVEDNGDDDQDCVMNVTVGHYLQFQEVSYDTDDEDDDNGHQGFDQDAEDDDVTDSVDMYDVSEDSQY